MAIKGPVLMEKKERKTTRKHRASLRPAAALEEMAVPTEVDASSESPVVFDPRLFLSKLTVGKTGREYPDKQALFSQGDKADAVFYIQSGKVKLTAVSKSGKEAVVGILQEGSFFGEGCLAGQPLRMATVTVMEPSTTTRVAKANGPNAPSGTGICRALSGLFAFPQHPYRRRPC